MRCPPKAEIVGSNPAGCAMSYEHEKIYCYIFFISYNRVQQRVYKTKHDAEKRDCSC